MPQLWVGWATSKMWSQALVPEGTLVHLLPLVMPTGLSEVMIVPVRSPLEMPMNP